MIDPVVAVGVEGVAGAARVAPGQPAAVRTAVQRSAPPAHVPRTLRQRPLPVNEQRNKVFKKMNTH